MKTPKVIPKEKAKDELVFQVRPALDIAEQLKIKVVSDKTINFSREKAFKYLEMDTFQGERSVNERHVQFLYNAWAGGRFMWPHVILATCQLNGRQYRINGQHTCWMRVNIENGFFVKLGEEPQVREVVYEVQDEEQLRILYSTFDQNKTRTPAHVFRALMAGTPQAQDLWPSSLNKLNAGLKMWLFEKDRHMVNSNDVATLVKEKHENLFRIVGLFLQSHDTDANFMKRAGVVAALFATFDKAGGKAPEFWDPVANGLGINDKTDPRYVLRDYLQTHGQGTATARAVRTSLGFVGAEDTYRICIHAWNKWRKGEKASRTYQTLEKRVKAQ